ncbi:MAG: hypothetical protein IT381_25340 [Deltaproteobacteria bacterium]|nr:hypothetical protein [Deltaproteobacteria bacterium]
MRLLFALACFGLVTAAAEEAQAQYKNSSFGAYGGAAIILPSNNLDWYKQFAITSNGGRLATGETAPQGNPFSLANAMFSFEFNFKISLESWFLKTGLNIGFLTVVRDDTAGPFPGAGAGKIAQGGVVFWLEGVFGPRYYFLTDNIRPFLEIGIRLAGAAYTTQANDIMPANWKVMPAVYGQFGMEFIVARDIGITILARYSRFIIVNFPGFNMLEGQAGVISYF